MLVLRWGLQLGSWCDHQANRQLQVLGLHLIPPLQGGMGPRHPHGIQLGPMPFHAAAQGLRHQIGDLLTADLHIGQPLPGQQQLCGQAIGLLLPLLPEAFAVLCVGDGISGDAHAIAAADDLISREGHGKTI